MSTRFSAMNKNVPLGYYIADDITWMPFWVVQAPFGKIAITMAASPTVPAFTFYVLTDSWPFKAMNLGEPALEFGKPTYDNWHDRPAHPGLLYVKNRRLKMRLVADGRVTSVIISDQWFDGHVDDKAYGEWSLSLGRANGASVKMGF